MVAFVPGKANTPCDMDGATGASTRPSEARVATVTVGVERRRARASSLLARGARERTPSLLVADPVPVCAPRGADLAHLDVSLRGRRLFFDFLCVGPRTPLTGTAVHGRASRMRNVDAEPLLAGQPARPSLLHALPPHIGAVFFLMAASLTLPITAYTVLIYQELDASPELASQYFLADFLFSLLDPIVGWLTDRGGPAARHSTIVVALVVKTVLLSGFAAGMVRSVGMPRYALAISKLFVACIAALQRNYPRAW